MKKILIQLSIISFIYSLKAQEIKSPCSHEEILKRQFYENFETINVNEAFTSDFIKNLKENRKKINNNPTYTIPVVLHVFHNGPDALINFQQIETALEVLNNDFNGLNSDWNSIDPSFNSIKSSLNIKFCLATIDPNGNTTNGVVYHDNEQGMLNSIDLFQFAWDNLKYLNIYLPKYINGTPSLFTGYAYYPDLNRTINNLDGIFYSSVRFGYGTNSELSVGQEWASVITHEVGHWLNLRHTFYGGCSVTNDLVEDTPPTSGNELQPTGCYNYNMSCGVLTNGENYMDYNIDCKKMFTQGQVDRMTAALNLPARINLWSNSNLIATGCANSLSISENKYKDFKVYPNPANSEIFFQFQESPDYLVIYSTDGKKVFSSLNVTKNFKINIQQFANGLYFYQVGNEKEVIKGKFLKN